MSAGGVTAVNGGAPGEDGAAGGDEGGGVTCTFTTPACECTWRTPACEATAEIIFSGQQCPPTAEDAMTVSNWPLGGPPMQGTPRRTGQFEECDDGSREFFFTECGDQHSFWFDGAGTLISWFAKNQACGGCTPATPNTSDPAASNCSVCVLTSDPPGEGESCFPTFMSNGPQPSCMVDANGRWLMPKACD